MFAAFCYNFCACKPWQGKLRVRSSYRAGEFFLRNELRKREEKKDEMTAE